MTKLVSRWRNSFASKWA